MEAIFDALDPRSRPGFESLSQEVADAPRAPPSGIRLRLARAGLDDEVSFAALVTAQALLACGLPAIVLWMPPVVAPAHQPWLVLGMGAVGWLLPLAHLDRRADERRRTMRRFVPDVLDLLVTCTEAGLGLDAALQLAAVHTHEFCPDLSAELIQVLDEVSGGLPRQQALDRMAFRTDLPETRTLALVVGQSTRMNAGIGESLRTVAEESRVRRLAEAEEQAKQAATVINVVALVALLPPFLLILVAPKLVEAFRTWEGM